MTNHLIGPRTPRLAIFAVAMALMPAVVSISAGAKDNSLSKAELKHLIATAGTKADHERIAEYFDAEAAKYEAEAKEHEELAQAYRKSGPDSAKYPGSIQSFNHCDSLSKSLAQAADNARRLAADQRKMAQESK